MTSRILVGDARAMLRSLEPNSVQTCVTSPPYFGLRAYGTNPQVWGGDPDHEHEWGAGRQRATGRNDAARLTAGLADGHGGGVSPPRQYATNGAFCPCGAWRGELGSEPTPEQFIANLTEVFREVRRVLHPTGTLWLNLGDSYAGSGKGPTGHNGIGDQAERQGFSGQENSRRNTRVPRPVDGYEREFRTGGAYVAQPKYAVAGYKAKDLMLMPFRVALALQADGWWLRNVIVWSKPNPMPESVTDRLTNSHEYVFLLSKRATYYFDAEAIREESAPSAIARQGLIKRSSGEKDLLKSGEQPYGAGHNCRSVWEIATTPFRDAHFATFPTEIPRRAILAGTSERGVCPECGAPWRRVVERGESLREVAHRSADRRTRSGRNDGEMNISGQEMMRWKTEHPDLTTGWERTCRHDAEPVPAMVLDPFLGSGTTLMVADRLQRNGIGIELNPQYALMAQYRIEQDAPLFYEGERIEAPSGPVEDKQGALGKRTYTGFNARWDAQQKSLESAS